jgi:hypothetical protein
MSGIGDLVANLTVNSAPFKKGLQSSKGLATSFASGFGKAMKVGVVGGLAAAAAGVYKVNEQLGELDKVANWPQELALTLSSLLRGVLRLNNLEAMLRRQTVRLTKFTKNMGDASDGTGAAATADKRTRAELKLGTVIIARRSGPKTLLKQSASCLTRHKGSCCV